MAFRSIPTYNDPYAAVRENRAGLRDVSDRRQRDKMQRQQLANQRKAIQARQGAALPRYGSQVTAGGESVADREQARRGRIREAQALAGIGAPDPTTAQTRQMQAQQQASIARQDQLQTQEMERQNQLAMVQEEAFAKRYGADAAMYGQVEAAQMGMQGQIGAAQIGADASMYGADRAAESAIREAELQKESWMESNRIQGKYGVKQAEVEAQGRQAIVEMQVDAELRKLEADASYQQLTLNEKAEARKQVAKLAAQSAKAEQDAMDRAYKMEERAYADSRNDLAYDRKRAEAAEQIKTLEARDAGIVQTRQAEQQQRQATLKVLENALEARRQHFVMTDPDTGDEIFDRAGYYSSPEVRALEEQYMNTVRSLTANPLDVSFEQLEEMFGQ